MLALEQAQAIIQAQETWDVNDDQCDCVHQRIGYWNNPYSGETLETRLCCVWAKFEAQWPELFRRTRIEPAEWNGETAMPKSLWHRQLANSFGISVSEARSLNLPAPVGKPRTAKPQVYLPWSGEYLLVDLG
jgi:hypothetical protein